MKNNLIFDIGFHKGEDAAYYLFLGYNVVAVDAGPEMIKMAQEKFKKEYDSGQLKLVHSAISEQDNETVEFNISDLTFWNSLKKEIAKRDNMKSETVLVPTMRLDTMMRNYGEPVYCKVDIEGYDAIALSTLKGSSFRPKYISCETECIGDKEVISDEEALHTLYVLKELGYTKFKLVDQHSLEVLTTDHFYWVRKKFSLIFRILIKAGFVKITSNIDRLKKEHGFKFEVACSGPFGADLKGEWVDFETAKRILLMHRSDFFSNKSVTKYGFWCDWHATK